MKNDDNILYVVEYTSNKEMDFYPLLGEDPVPVYTDSEAALVQCIALAGAEVQFAEDNPEFAEEGVPGFFRVAKYKRID